MYYKPATIVNDDTRVVNKLEASRTDDARVIIYNHQMFIVQATESPPGDSTIKYKGLLIYRKLTDFIVS
jgi:hypothetical protein